MSESRSADWLDSLAEKLEKATPGPWEAHVLDGTADIYAHGTGVAYDRDGGCTSPEDAEAIVALRNHGETLILRARAAEWYRDTLEKLLPELPEEGRAHKYVRGLLSLDSKNPPTAEDRAWLAKLGEAP